MGLAAAFVLVMGVQQHMERCSTHARSDSVEACCKLPMKMQIGGATSSKHQTFGHLIDHFNNFPKQHLAYYNFNCLRIHSANEPTGIVLNASHIRSDVRTDHDRARLISWATCMAGRIFLEMSHWLWTAFLKNTFSTQYMALCWITSAYCSCTLIAPRKKKRLLGRMRYSRHSCFDCN